MQARQDEDDQVGSTSRAAVLARETADRTVGRNMPPGIPLEWETASKGPGMVNPTAEETTTLAGEITRASSGMIEEITQLDPLEHARTLLTEHNKLKADAGAQLDFDHWAQIPNQLVSTFPDYYTYTIERKWPDTDRNGMVIAGVQCTKLTEQLSQDWMLRKFGDGPGGRFAIVLRGPHPRTGANVILAGAPPVTIPSFEIQQRQSQMEARIRRDPATEMDTSKVNIPAPAPDMAVKEEPVMQQDRSNDGVLAEFGRKYIERIERAAESTSDPIVGRSAPAAPGATPEPVTIGGHVQPAVRGKTNGTEDPDEEEADIPPLPRRAPSRWTERDMDYPPPRRAPVAPPAPPAPSPAEAALASSFAKMLEAVTRPVATAPQAVPVDRSEVDRLHALLSKQQDDARNEQTDRLREQRLSLEKIIDEQRKTYERLIKDAEDRSRALVDMAESRARAEIERLTSTHAEQVRQLNERCSDARDELRTTRDDAAQMRRDLATAQSDLTMARSELTAVKLTQEATVGMIKADARADAAEKAQQAQIAKGGNDDPMTKMLQAVTQAKTVAKELGEQLGGGGGSKTEDSKPASRFDQLVDAAAKVAGSPDIRKLASTVTEAAVKGVGAVVQSRRERIASGIPSTDAIAAAYRRQSPVGAASAPALSRAPAAPAQLERAVVPNPGVMGEIEKMSDSMAQVKLAAEGMLDEVEDMAAAEEKVEVATEYVIERLQEMAGSTRGEILAQLREATAADTLASLDLPASRLSPNATAYLDSMIAHAKTLS